MVKGRVEVRAIREQDRLETLHFTPDGGLTCDAAAKGLGRGEAKHQGKRSTPASTAPCSFGLSATLPRWRAAWLAWRKLRRADRSQRQAQHETARMQRERTQRELQALRDPELREWHHRFIGTDSGLQRFKDFWQD